MDTLSIKWWQALNPAIYLISVLPSFAILSLSEDSTIWLDGLIIATISVVLLQHAINLFNDVSDWKLGADIKKMDSWVRVHNQNTTPVMVHGIISFLAAGLLGLTLLILSDRLWILFIAVPLIVLGYLYNAGKRPLSYTWMGEWVTGICYGGVFACLWLVIGLKADVTIIFGSITFGLLAMSLLLSHQPPQIKEDREAGKHSFAVRYGGKATYKTSLILFIFSLLFLVAGVMINHHGSIVIYALSLALLVTFMLIFSKGVNPKSILFGACSVIIALWLAT